MLQSRRDPAAAKHFGCVNLTVILFFSMPLHGLPTERVQEEILRQRLVVIYLPLWVLGLLVVAMHALMVYEQYCL
jgi:hypothetical protein